MKGSKKTRKNIIIAFTVILFLVVGFFATLYYITSTVNNYSYSEKKWINDNKDTRLDVYVENGLPVFSDNGKGVYYEYLKSLKETTNLTIEASTSDNTEVKLNNKTSVDPEDIVIYKDHYVVIGKKDSINKLSDLSNKSLGVINTDRETIERYLTEYQNINIKGYTSFEQLESEYTSNKLDYMIIPMYKYLDEIVKNNYEIIFHMDGLYSYYCLDLPEGNETLSNIFSKFYYRWEKTAAKKINEYFLDLYYTTKNYTEIEKESITNDDLIVGYIENLPYEGMIRRNFTGLTDTYLSKFADMTGVTYKYIKYSDTKKLGEALDDKKIDLALNYYSLGNKNYTSSRTLGPTEYVVIAHVDNNLVVNSLYSLNNTEVNMLSNMNLKYNMASKNLFEIKEELCYEENINFLCFLWRGTLKYC